MPRSPYVLAALLSAALPAARPVRARLLESDGDLDEAVVEDAGGRSWVVRAPRRAAGGASLEREVELLTALRATPHAALPFRVPDVAGSAPLPEGGRALVQPWPPGAPLDPAALIPGPGAAASLGRALAAVHELPASIVEDAGLPVYEAADYRDRRLSELDRAAATGEVPSRLLGRWERALEDVGRWRFPPAVVHGDLVEDHVLVDVDGEVTAVLAWGEAKVADPADDFAWLAAGASEEAFESVLESYALARADIPDRHLAQRARLAGELALTRWLLHGVHTGDAEVVADAARMLSDLDLATGEDRL
ncbi:phosphotransferase [Quadrisphaera sp. DSM 44207]|uniref:phosphotransferase n=1 Tax=Quadrisphaera sp. DSM 44207 TaxID=1881057 RepID=UPI000886476A|nr:phosphotransferase [Quadrisphaera sp. DSM 44207]SDQ72515.1 Predicted kinase, aminoglycoside phosphotransferase (APT) family [Quadrisphaera sp. DSM 44207]